MVRTQIFFIPILKQNCLETIVSESDATPHRSVDGLDGQPKVRKKLWGKSGHL